MFQACHIVSQAQHTDETYGGKNQDVVVVSEFMDQPHPHVEAKDERKRGKGAKGDPETEILSVPIDGHGDEQEPELARSRFWQR